MLVMSVCESSEDVQEVNFQRGLQGEKSGIVTLEEPLGWRTSQSLSLRVEIPLPSPHSILGRTQLAPRMC